MRNLSIRNKLIILILIAAIPSIVIGFSFIIIRDIFDLQHNLVNRTRLNAELVGRYCISPITFEHKKGVMETLDKMRITMPNIDQAFVYNEKGEVYGIYSRTGKDTITPPPAPQRAFDRYKADSLHVAREIFWENRSYGYIYMIASTDELSQNTRNRIFSLVLVMTGLIVLSYLLALRFQRVISEPILRLAGVTENISRQADYSVRVKKQGSDEIGILYDGFNNMLEQIQRWGKERDRALAEQIRLLAKVEEKNTELEQVIYVTSHDLRSPLVNIQGFEQELSYSLKELLKILEIIDLPEKEKHEIYRIIDEDILDSLKFIHSSTIKMEQLLSGLLKLSRLDRMESTFEMIDMNRMMAEIISSFEFQIKEAEVMTQVEKLPSCFGSELQVNQLFSNLVNNAIKYIDPHRPGRINISGYLDSENNQAVYCIEDNGIGIPEEHQERIFGIFYRLNPEAGEGDGLGLAIVQKIVNRHNGRVWVESKEGKGSRFFIALPAMEDSQDLDLS